MFVGKVEKEVQNVRLKTTVTDVINALIRDKGEEAASATQWVIVECWRGIERPLPPRTRLLKVWCAWRDERDQVRLYLKRAQKTFTSRNAHNRCYRKRRPIRGEEFFIDGPKCQSDGTKTSTSSSSASSLSSEEISCSPTDSSTSDSDNSVEKGTAIQNQ